MIRQQYLGRVIAIMLMIGAATGWVGAQKKMAIKPNVNVSPAAIKPGDKFQIKVTLNLPANVHINSNKPEDEFAIPTELKLNAASGFTVEPVRYPAGAKHTYSYAKNGITVYEGKVEMTIPVQAQKDAKPGKYPLKGQLQWQPCDADVCYPPEKAEIAAMIQIQ